MLLPVFGVAGAVSPVDRHFLLVICGSPRRCLGADAFAIATIVLSVDVPLTRLTARSMAVLAAAVNREL
jgi:hypothetical protein